MKTPETHSRDPYAHCIPVQGQKFHRVTCSVQGKRNDWGKPKLNLLITADGLYYWCKCCRTEHFLSHEELGRIRDELEIERNGEQG